MSRKMKDSGIKWIGEIPEDWETIKLKYMLKIIGGNGFPELLQGNSSGKFPFCKVSDINSKDIYVDKANNYISEDIIKEYNFSIIPSNSILIAKIGEALKKNHRKINTVDCIIDNNMQAFVAKENVKYAYYLLSSIDMTWFDNNGTVPSINNFNLKNFKVPKLSYIQQQKIANFLDKKVAEIDHILEKTRESIEEYKKYKQSLITEAVTKGLNPDVEMKDSGIEWIGEIPKHWEVKPFKYILNERNETNEPILTEERLSLSIDKGVTLYSEKTTNLDRFKDDVSKYKLAHEGDLVLNSMNMIVGAVGISKYFGCVSPAYYTYYEDNKEPIAAKFCDYLFKTKPIKKVLYSLGKGIMSIDRGDDKFNTVRLKVPRNDLRLLKFPVPKREEQISIINYLDNKCTEIDSLISQKEALLSELETYKKSLIYECVTGKREVD